MYRWLRPDRAVSRRFRYPAEAAIRCTGTVDEQATVGDEQTFVATLAPRTAIHVAATADPWQA